MPDETARHGPRRRWSRRSVGEPLRESPIEVRTLGPQPGLQRGQLGSNAIEGRLRLRIDDHHCRARHARVRNLPALVDAVEEAEQPEIVLLADRVELVVVAPRALDAHAQQRASERVHTVGDVLDPILLRDDAALLALHVVAIEAGGQPLLVGGRRQQVARQLPRDELVERQVAVEGANHPVPPRPHGPHPVVLVAVRVGVPRDVEPLDGHSLAVGRRGQQPIDDAFVGVGRLIGHECVDVGQCRRQSREVHRDASQQRLARRLGRRAQPVRFERGQHEAVDLAAGPAVGAGPRHRRPPRRDEGPMRFPLGALLNPAHENRSFEIVESQMRVRRGHHHLRVGAENAPDQLTTAGVAGHDGAPARRQLAKGDLAHIQAEAGLAHAVVGTVALEAPIREERLDVEVEVDDVGHAGDRDRHWFRRAITTSAMAAPARTIAMPTRRARTCRLYGGVNRVHRFTGSPAQLQRAQRPHQNQPGNTGRGEEDRQGRSREVAASGRTLEPGARAQLGADARERFRVLAPHPHVPSPPLAAHVQYEPATVGPRVGDVGPLAVPAAPRMLQGDASDVLVQRVRDMATAAHATPTTPIAWRVTADPSATKRSAALRSPPGSTSVPTRQSITNNPTSTTAAPSDARRTPRRKRGTPGA